MPTLRELAVELSDFARERDWEKFHDPKNLSMMICSEAGELAALLRWISNDEADEFANEPANRSKLEDEIADVGIGLVMLCSRLGLRLEDAMHEKIQKNRGRFPPPPYDGPAGV